MNSRAIVFFCMRFWPGFQKLWLKGDFHSLFVSLLFGWVVVFFSLGTFVWPEWFVIILSPRWLAKVILVTGWISIITTCLLSGIGLLFGNANTPNISLGERQKNLEKAQELYLRANYYEAEQLIKRNVSGRTEDIESHLLWIAILRRTRRIPQALELISSVDKLDAAAPWISELRLEKEQCVRIKIQTPPAHN